MTCPRCGHPEYSPEAGCPACSQQTPAPKTGSTSVITSAEWEDAVTRLEPLAEGAETKPPSSASTTGVLQAGQQFGARYQILKVLGKGGMGVVYRAWDEELGVAVALKVIRPEMANDPKGGLEIERRFKRELVLARQVTHKNVVRIHDLGEMDGIKYLTMPFIQGQDLAGVIAAAGKLPVERALVIARQLAAGLAAAHEVGVIHRDLKPANIMLDDEDHAIILDFGIARSTSGPTMATGAMVGTVAYMAPEQADGRPVDQRADIYAFGLVLYDMLVGKRRMAGSESSAIVELMSRLREPPRAVRELEPQVPEGLAEVISRCLTPEPAGRYQTSAHLVAALDGLDSSGHTKLPPEPVVVTTKRSRFAPYIAAAALLLSATAIWLAVRPRPSAVTVQRDPVSVIIADFDNRTGDEVFDGSLEQALGLGVEGSSFVTAFSRRDARRVAQEIRPGTRLDETLARLVAQREGIKVVLSGTITAAGDRYEVGVRAIEAEPGRLVAELSESVRGKPAVLDAVATVAASIREALGDTNLDSAPRETFTTASLEAAREYAVAQELANQDRDEEAVARYRRAIELDSTFGRAYSGWAASARKLGRHDEAEKMYQEAFKFLERMTEREKFRTLGAYYMQIARDYDKAIENYEALVERYPADSAGHNNLAVAYFSVLDFARAREEGEKLVAIYPNSVLYRYNLALYAMYASDFARATTEANEALKLNPASHRPYVALALSAIAKEGGRPAEARAIYQKAAATAGRQGISLSHIGLADLSMFEGQFTDAASILTKGAEVDLGEKNQAGAAVKLVAFAEAQTALGETTAAVQTLTRARALAQPPEVQVPSALLLVSLGRVREAEEIGKALDSQLPPQPRAYGRLIAARLALARNEPSAAVSALREGIKLADLWLLRFWLGVALVQANAHPQALSDLEACDKRRGEATAIFLDDVPSWRYMAPLHYWLGRAREGTGQRTGAVAAYNAFLGLRPNRAADPLAEDAARRVASLATP